jgi:hypothetical protein
MREDEGGGGARGGKAIHKSSVGEFTHTKTASNMSPGEAHGFHATGVPSRVNEPGMG